MAPVSHTSGTEVPWQQSHLYVLYTQSHDRLKMLKHQELQKNMLVNRYYIVIKRGQSFLL